MGSEERRFSPGECGRGPEWPFREPDAVILDWTRGRDSRTTRPAVNDANAAAPPDSPRVDERRLEDLLTRYSGLLTATIRRVCPRDLGIDTQDIEQEARVRLWRALSRATDADPAASYIQKVAATSAIDAIRAALARRDRTALADLGNGGEESDDSAEMATGEASPEDRMRRKQLAEAIEASVAELSAARCRAVRLHLWGLSSPEISLLTGWSGTKTRSLISRGLAEVRNSLRKKGVDAHVGS